MLTLRATANHVIALQYLCMCLMSQMFLFYFIFYGGVLVFLGGAGAPASPSLAPPMALGHTVCVADLERVCCITAAEKSASLLFCRRAAVAVW